MSDIKRGDLVRVARGRKHPVGAEGRVFWVAEDGARIGIKDDPEDEQEAPVWLDARTVDVVQEAPIDARDLDADDTQDAAQHGDCLRALGVVRAERDAAQAEVARLRASLATECGLVRTLEAECDELRARPPALDARAVRALADHAGDSVRKAVLGILTPEAETPARGERLAARANGTNGTAGPHEERARRLDLDPAPARDPNAGARKRPVLPEPAAPPAEGPVQVALVKCAVCGRQTEGPVAGHALDCGIRLASIVEAARKPQAVPEAPRAPEIPRPAPVALEAPKPARKGLLPKCPRCRRIILGEHTC